MKSLMMIMLLCLALMVGGCVGAGGNSTPYQKTYQTLSVSKHTAVFIATTAKDLHFNGVLDDVQISKVRSAYERVQKAQAILIDTQKLAIDAGDLEGNERVAALSTVYLRTMTEFVNMAIEIGLLEPGDERIRTRPRPIPAPPPTTL